jgi:assimilatory nitrate reductase catalytic subunit
VAPELIAELDAALDLDHERCALDYSDARRGIARRVLIRDDKVIGARLTGETIARDWLRDLIAGSDSAEAVRRWVLAPLAAPPGGQRRRGRIVCNCLDVAETEINERLAAGLSLAEVQDALKCGTSCGSCVPELRRMAGHVRAAA